MSTPRLQLKQPTGWFAAGREFTQALTLLSDGAFKLYVHLCLNANRHTGRLSATVDDLARVLTRAPTSVAMNLDELEACAVCRVIRNGSQLVLEIRDRFWPYEKQQTPGCVPEPEVEFVQKVRNMFLAPACVQAGFSAADEKIATVLHRRGVSLEQISQPSFSDVPANMSPCSTPGAGRRSTACNTSPMSSTKCVRHPYRKATGNRFARRSHAWRNSGYWRKLLRHDATVSENLPTSAESLPT